MTFENKNTVKFNTALLAMDAMDSMLDYMAENRKQKMTMEEEAALYKEVTGKDLVYIPIEDTPDEFQAALHYFAELGGTEK